MLALMMSTMRTTLTIDDDLAGLLKRRARELGLPFKDLVNRTLRAGLGEQAKPRRHNSPRTVPHAFGFRPGIDLDKLNQLVDELEAETYAAGQRSESRIRRPARHDLARRQRSRSRA
jgi:hypothetical protein